MELTKTNPISKPTATFGRATITGVIWATLSVGVTKGAGFVSQLVLGWLLSEDDFGLYALAASLSLIVTALQDGGATTILIQRGHQYDQLARAVMKLALTFKFIGAVMIAAIAPLAATFFDAPGLPILLWVLAANLILSAPQSVYRAKLQIDLKFAALARINAIAAVLRNLAMIGFALGGLGPLSFVLPLLIVTPLTWAWLRVAAGPLPATGLRLRSVGRELLSASQWIVLAALAGTIVQQGDYLVVGKLLDKEALGFYFFGFQLTASAAMLFTAGLRSVLMPVLSRLTDETERQAKAYIKTIRTLTFVTAPTGVLIALLAEPIIHLLWNGRWDPSIPAAQFLALGYILNLLSTSGGALIEARGRWRLRAAILIGSSIATMVAATAGALYGSIFAIALCVAVKGAAVGVINAWVAGRLVNITFSEMFRQVFPPVASATMVGAVVFGASQYLFATDAYVAPLIFGMAAFMAGYALLTAAFMRRQSRELLTAITRRKHQADASAPADNC